MEGKNVVVTGGAGFIGSHLVDELVRRGAEVAVVDNLSTGDEGFLEKSKNKINTYFVSNGVGDIRGTSYKKCLEDAEVVFHLAAKRSVPESVDNPKEFYDVNITGTDNLMRMAVDAGVRRVVLASSSSVYGIQENVPFREDMMPNPISPYAVSKRAAEMLLKAYNKLYGIETVSLRYFNVIGPRQDLTSKYAMVVPAFVTRLLDEKKPTIYGTGEQERDFSYVFDVVRANILAAQSYKVGEGEVINVSGGHLTSVNELLDMLQGMLGTDIDPVHAPKRPGDVPITYADLNKAKRLLDYEPICEMEYALEQCINYLEGKQ